MLCWSISFLHAVFSLTTKIALTTNARQAFLPLCPFKHNPSPIRPSIVTIAEKNQEIGPGKGPRARYQVLSVPFVNFFYVSQNLISVMGFLFCRTQLQHRWGLQHKNAETEVSSSLISIFFFSFLDEKFHCCCMLDYKFLICKSL